MKIIIYRFIYLVLFCIQFCRRNFILFKINNFVHVYIMSYNLKKNPKKKQFYVLQFKKKKFCLGIWKRQNKKQKEMKVLKVWELLS